MDEAVAIQDAHPDRNLRQAAKSLIAAIMMLPTLLFNTNLVMQPSNYLAPTHAVSFSSAARADDELAKYAAEGNPVVRVCALSPLSAGSLTGKGEESTHLSSTPSPHTYIKSPTSRL